MADDTTAGLANGRVGERGFDPKASKKGGLFGPPFSGTFRLRQI